MTHLDVFSLEGQVVLLAGGTGILGSRFARTLADAGAHVVVGGRDASKCRALADTVGGTALELDVTDLDGVRKAVRGIVKTCGVLHGLVNMASYSAPAETNGIDKNPDGFDPEDFRASLSVDLEGSFNCCVAAGEYMCRQRKGTIVNVCSIYGITAPVQSIYADLARDDGTRFIKPPGYGAAKAGVRNLSKYLAVRWADSGVRVNTLVLGGVEAGQHPGFLKRYSERTPLGRMARPDEYGAAAVFMLSEAASYMVGAELVLDGGWTAW